MSLRRSKRRETTMMHNQQTHLNKKTYLWRKLILKNLVKPTQTWQQEGSLLECWSCWWSFLCWLIMRLTMDLSLAWERSSGLASALVREIAISVSKVPSWSLLLGGTKCWSSMSKARNRQMGRRCLKNCSGSMCLTLQIKGSFSQLM